MDASFRRTYTNHLPALKADLLAGKRLALSKCITLIESTREDDQVAAGTLIEEVIGNTGNSIRIGITGVPGVGKSTFIEQFGTLLTEVGRRVAVLSVDPTSIRSKGAILGDKTRMHSLSKNPKAFVRPSAAGANLGGVANTTRECILLCEAAGYDVIIVETVGVGQSETLVKEMVDYFLLLMLAGGGDELQGIKRGIMEMADHLLINKADGANLALAEKAAKDYENALHLFPASESQWKVPVGICSALENTGLHKVWQSLQSFQSVTQESGFFSENRRLQNCQWFHQRLRTQLLDYFFGEPDFKGKIKQKEDQIKLGKSSVRKAVDDLLQSQIHKIK
ncbi:MAG: methylmalonyl Co-A mutase-associated GTPase MeaB [Bacteroidota bacterium]